MLQAERLLEDLTRSSRTHQLVKIEWCKLQVVCARTASRGKHARQIICGFTADQRPLTGSGQQRCCDCYDVWASFWLIPTAISRTFATFGFLNGSPPKWPVLSPATWTSWARKARPKMRWSEPQLRPLLFLLWKMASGFQTSCLSNKKWSNWDNWKHPQYGKSIRLFRWVPAQVLQPLRHDFRQGWPWIFLKPKPIGANSPEKYYYHLLYCICEW